MFLLLCGPLPVLENGYRTRRGPALFSTSVAATGGSHQSDRRLGCVTEFGLSLPPRSRVFGELLVQYRHAGEIDAGPYTATGRFSGQTLTLPATSVRMNHWFVGLGAGVRF